LSRFIFSKKWGLSLTHDKIHSINYYIARPQVLSEKRIERHINLEVAKTATGKPLLKASDGD